MTVLEIIQRSAQFLAKKGVDSPRLQIELLLAHVLQMPRLQLYLNFDRRLTTNELERVRNLVKRRGQREPLQHILGSTSFCGLEIAVDPNVLIPRPETELLAERAWSFLNSRAAGGAPSALDFGTGSGCLAIALAMKCPEAKIYALDISPGALSVARQNAVRHTVAERIQFFEGDGFSALPASSRFDLIAANPPYIPSTAIDALQLEVRDYDPRVALDGGEDGLDFFRRLAAEAAAHLNPGGRMMLEFGDDQGDALRKLFTAHNWIVEAIESDYTARARILIAAAPLP
ncbi:MAG: peptide chain release factor N(5)-glutamine methyltransferase [Verrucomicrobiota bacterium]